MEVDCGIYMYINLVTYRTKKKNSKIEYVMLLRHLIAAQTVIGLEQSLFFVNVIRVPTVMKSQGKSWKNLWSWKVIENQKKISEVMEN